MGDKRIIAQLEFAVLGRDVLNRFYVRLDGPGLMFAMDAREKDG